jgi:adenylosuccinate lyase
MKLNALTAISPIDGRYREKTVNLSAYFSEFALVRYRILVEIEYFISLCEWPLPQLANINQPDIFRTLREIYTEFSLEDAVRIKEIEKTTNHDVKAVEYFIKEKFEKAGLKAYKEFIHFGLTSQDINNTAVPLSIKNALETTYFPLLERLIETLSQYADDWNKVPMLAKTHGQPASPTRLGKEIRVFVSRLEQQVRLLKQTPVSAKFGGATGNYNAHHLAYPDIDWKYFGNKFVEEKLHLTREEYTTQISNYDNLSALFDGLKRINTVLIDLTRDFWLYISMEYFKQQIKAGEIGSSAMPHKVNPIDFENAEGNLGIANAILEHLSAKLPVSRLQRDLTDSTVLRNVGVPFGHILISFHSIQKGLGKLLLNKQAIERDLENAWAVVAEGIQTILRRESYPEPYEALKALTRTNEQITEKSIREFIDSLQVSKEVKQELFAITPQSYTGI